MRRNLFDGVFHVEFEAAVKNGVESWEVVDAEVEKKRD